MYTYRCISVCLRIYVYVLREEETLILIALIY